MDKVTKPLNRKSYGHIGHLPGSRMTPGDHHVHDGQKTIVTLKVRDRHDVIVVQEKLDGSCCAVAKLESGEVVALGRAGYLAQTSKYEQHQLFAAWVREREEQFSAILNPGERLVGEWLAQAHGTRYALPHEPFVVFDLMKDEVRANYRKLCDTLRDHFTQPRLLHLGGPFSIEQMLAQITTSGHGAIDPVEGAVWRVERRDEVDFLAKYVRPEKIDGLYLPELSGKEAVWNWRPDHNGISE